MKFCLFYVVLGTLLLFQVEAVKKELIKEVNICKRNTPDLGKCYGDNFNQIMPLLKDGQPAMGIPPLDPIKVDYIKLNLAATRSVHLNASLYDVMLHGISKGRAVKCISNITKNGFQSFFDLYLPIIALKSNYSASGKFLLVAIESDGDFHGEFTDARLSSIWNSTKFMKNGREFLQFNMSKVNLEMKSMKIHFNNVFGNNTELNDNLNEVVNSNIHLLYDEIKPVLMETIQAIISKLINDFYALFPYDELFPVE